MKTDIKVKHIMTRELVVANLNNRFSQVLDFFCQFKIAHLPIVEEDKIVGIISVNDALNFLYAKLGAGNVNVETLNEEFKMEDLMTPDPVHISPEAGLDEALEMLDKGRFQALPVVEDGKLVGIVTNKDLVKSFSFEVNPVEKRSTYTIETSGFGI
ncbi:MAG: CBS domain-containing protein [Bacteroidetes bacterium]|nr:CBS domain-containing protein [Bacteroidota bacterium]